MGERPGPGDDAIVLEDDEGVATTQANESAEVHAIGEWHAPHDGAECFSRPSEDGDTRGPAHRRERPGGEDRRAEPDAVLASEHALKGLAVPDLEGALEVAVARERVRPVGHAGGLGLVRPHDGPQPGLEPRIHLPRLAAARDGVQAPGRGSQRKQRDKQEIRDEFESEAHLDPTIEFSAVLPITTLKWIGKDGGKLSRILVIVVVALTFGAAVLAAVNLPSLVVNRSAPVVAPPLAIAPGSSAGGPTVVRAAPIPQAAPGRTAPAPAPVVFQAPVTAATT